MKIVKAHPGHVEALMDLIDQFAFEEEEAELEPHELRSAVEFLVRHPEHGFYLLAIDSETEEILGYLEVLNTWNTWCNGYIWWLQGVYIVPAARRQHVFSCLIRTLEQEADRNKAVAGLRLSVKDSNFAARQAYARNGFLMTHYTVCQKMRETSPAEEERAQPQLTK